jgi:hypothetical protein
MIRCLSVALAIVAALAVNAIAVPARADWDDHHGWRHWHHWHGDWGWRPPPPPVYYRPPPPPPPPPTWAPPPPAFGSWGRP